MKTLFYSMVGLLALVFIAGAVGIIIAQLGSRMIVGLVLALLVILPCIPFFKEKV
jgi:hypothetical protein